MLRPNLYSRKQTPTDEATSEATSPAEAATRNSSRQLQQQPWIAKFVELVKPEAHCLTSHQSMVLDRMEQVARFMDLAVPVPCLFGYKIGIDAIVGGILPVVGDFMGAGVSLVILIRIYWVFDRGLVLRKGFPLLLNIIIDVGLGTIPILGIFMDDAWNCNMKNLNIVRKYYGLEKLEW